ncbi:hypothetical protein WMF18_19675 [Sorangium sp. So ce315]
MLSWLPGSSTLHRCGNREIVRQRARTGGGEAWGEAGPVGVGDDEGALVSIERLLQGREGEIWRHQEATAEQMRIHSLGLPRRDAEEGGAEVIDVVEEPPPARCHLARRRDIVIQECAEAQRSSGTWRIPWRASSSNAQKVSGERTASGSRQPIPTTAMGTGSADGVTPAGAGFWPARPTTMGVQPDRACASIDTLELG